MSTTLPNTRVMHDPINPTSHAGHVQPKPAGAQRGSLHQVVGAVPTRGPPPASWRQHRADGGQPGAGAGLAHSAQRTWSQPGAAGGALVAPAWAVAGRSFRHAAPLSSLPPPSSLGPCYMTCRITSSSSIRVKTFFFGRTYRPEIETPNPRMDKNQELPNFCGNDDGRTARRGWHERSGPQRAQIDNWQHQVTI